VLAARGPVLIVLDDLHWAAAPTVALVRHLVTRSDPMAVLMIGTYRSTEAQDPLGEARRSMFQAYGLYGHIQANRVRSVLLLLGFVALLHALLFSVLLLWSALLGGTFEQIAAGAWAQFARSWPIAMLGALAWFVIAWFAHQTLIGMATGAKGVTRTEAPKLYNTLENLCVSRGLPMPALQIIDSPALNAYASGIREGQYVVAVTRGLVDTLSDDELEAVLAHELTHIRNRDTQLLVIAVIFAGIFAFFGDMVIRNWDFPYGWSPRPRQPGPWGSSRRSDSRRPRRSRPSRRRHKNIS